ncbi:MAG: hypothetical protein A3J83_03485 [Elusimicrobia bacterium RIFOXYA2_FULL_40_6]|nr:MAG: hypothetical protein A3J83_03485 [Elusimicrobia bacterium RIFOXYA2_FULL_40_6]
MDQQLVIFQLANEEYGIPINQIQEITHISEITRVPAMPDFVEGIINLRGKIIPVIDLRKRFLLDQKTRDEKSRIIVAETHTSEDKQEKQSVGLIVDSVSEVKRFGSEQIENIPTTISKIESDYLSGIGKLNNRIVIILDLKKIMSDLEKRVQNELKQK